MKKEILFLQLINWFKKTLAPKEKKIHVIGLGGAGCNTAKYFCNKGVNATYTCMSNAERKDLPEAFLFAEYHIYSEEKRLQIIIGKVRVDFENMKPDLPTALPLPIAERLNSNSRFILLVGLGGLTGSYLVRDIADLLKKDNREFAIICSLPFNFEGEIRNSCANMVKDKLSGLPNFHYYLNENMREKYGNLRISEAFDKTDEEVLKMFSTLNW